MFAYFVVKFILNLHSNTIEFDSTIIDLKANYITEVSFKDLEMVQV